jgi:hypothetical protein
MHPAGPPDGRAGHRVVISQPSEPNIIIGICMGLGWRSGVAAGFS